MKKTLAYRNEVFEKKTEQELASALEASQRLLDCWRSLDLPVTWNSLFELAHNPNGVYTKAVGEIGEATVSHGRFQIKKDVFINLVQAPVPNSLYLACSEFKRQVQTGRPQIWSISEDGKTVLMDQEKANELIHANDVWVTNEKQAEFIENCLAFMRTTNWLYDNLLSMPGYMSKFGPPYNLTAKGALISRYEIEPQQLKILIDSMA